MTIIVPVNLVILSAGCPTFNALVNVAEDRLLSSVILNSYTMFSALSSSYPHQTALCIVNRMAVTLFWQPGKYPWHTLGFHFHKTSISIFKESN